MENIAVPRSPESNLEIGPRLKIVFLGDALAEHLLRWSKYIARLGHEVHVITWNNRTLNGFDPVVLHKIRKKTLFRHHLLDRVVNLVWCQFRVNRLLVRIKPDMIHSHSAGAYSWVGMLSRFHPFIATPWGDDIFINIHRSWLDRRLTLMSLRTADLVHCDGINTRNALLDIKVSPAKIVMTTFGVDVDRFNTEKPPKDFEKKYGLEGFKVVVSTRTLNPIHDVKTVIRSIPLVLNGAPDAKWLIAGSGSEEERLKKLAEEIGIGSSVIFLGHVPEETMIHCLQSGDIYVSTSISESGLAASTAEAMSCGLPIINTETGDIRMWIEEGRGGSIIPVNDPNALAEKTLSWLNNDALRRRAGEINRRAILERNNVHVEMKKMEDIYTRLSKGDERRPT